MRRILIILLIISTWKSYAQTADTSNICLVKINLASPLNFVFPTLQVSVEKSISRHFSFEAEGGYQLFGLRNIDSIPLKAKGFKTDLALKYYFLIDLNKKTKLKNSGLYVGLQPFFKQNQYARVVNYYSKSDSLNFKTDGFGVKKTQIGMNCIVGFQQLFFHKKLAVDLFLGIGGKHLNVQNYYRNYDPALDRVRGTDLVPYFAGLDMKENSGAKINMTAGLKIGFKI